MKLECKRTGKITYLTQDEAHADLSKIGKSSSTKKPCRVYPCEFCGHYHLTSRKEFTIHTQPVRLKHAKQFAKFLL